MKSIKNIFLFLCVLAILPFGLSHAQSNTGEMQINIYDQDGQPFSGTWYLHQGPNDDGLTIRNGSLGETFQLNEGYYTLVAHGKTYQYPYVVIHSDNPQEVITGQTAVFNVQYFQTEEQMLNATGETPAITTTSPSTNTIDEDLFDEFGCNRTEGYVWCEREQKCAKPWYLACKVETPAEEVAEEVVSEPVATTSLRSSYVSPQSFADVPTFNMAPTTSTSTVTSAATPETFELVTTGPSAALAAMIGSMMLSGLAIRRKK
ncbi:hypothetical protein KAR91_07485 [Candidatus Pacearchaeota archaeon]|nr:hypothetical protein [Candidatus Pacearchaeota archaeon]